MELRIKKEQVATLVTLKKLLRASVCIYNILYIHFTPVDIKHICSPLIEDVDSGSRRRDELFVAFLFSRSIIKVLRSSSCSAVVSAVSKIDQHP